MNGLPALEFDGAGDYLSTADVLPLEGDAAFTVFMVSNILTPHGSYPVGWVFGNPSAPAAGAALLIEYGVPALATGYFYDAYPAAGSFDAHYGVPSLITVSKAPGPIDTTRIFFDGVEQDVTGNATVLNLTAGAFQLGSWNGSQPMRIDVSEIAVYGVTLTDGDRAEAECSLGAKYSIAVSPAEGCD